MESVAACHTGSHRFNNLPYRLRSDWLTWIRGLGKGFSSPCTQRRHIVWPWQAQARAPHLETLSGAAAVASVSSLTEATMETRKGCGVERVKRTSLLASETHFDDLKGRQFLLHYSPF
ncbi:unnamed protein product [Gadus morhua 'NCC']